MPLADAPSINMSKPAEEISPVARRLRPDSLAVSVAILLVVGVLQRTIGFGRGVLFCRWLTPEELGHWEMAYSFLLLAAPVVVLGLPGSFGRYLERYRQRGQLRTFLRRSTIWTATLVVLAVVAIVATAPQFSYLIFGRHDQLSLTLLIAISLVAVILHHFLEALFAALRKFRIVSTMHFCQSMLFAGLSLGLLWWVGPVTECIIVAYGLACLVSAVAALLWTHHGLSELAVPDDALPHSEFWPPLVRFAVWVWVINLLCHMFGVVDRYMLVHCSGLDNATALALVGHYHASRIVPLLFISVADLLAGVVMPYLSHDWEAGERARVSDRLNLVLKFTSVGMLATGVVVLWFAPMLFHVAFEGRYDEGLKVMPWTLTYCVWYALLIVGQNYIWCAEHTKLGAIPLAVGLVVNIGLNLVLIPAWGLLGAVIATTIATGLAVAVLYGINHRAGMRLDAGMLWLSFAPVALCGGAVLGTVTMVLMAVLMVFSRTLVSQHERDQINELARSLWKQLSERWERRNPSIEASQVTS
jgi:O-antigen/teichoic acid export membrane protein